MKNVDMLYVAIYISNVSIYTSNQERGNPMTDTTTRRRVLLGLGAACTAATAAPELGAAMPAENPDLLALADGLPAVLGAYQAAAKQVAEIVAHWGPQ